MQSIHCPARNKQLKIQEIESEQFAPEGWCKHCEQYQVCLEKVRELRQQT